jgi:hypothetical protein
MCIRDRRSPRERKTEPSVGSSSPARMRSRVVLPTPLLPTIAMLALWGIEMLIPSKISTGPNERPRFCEVSSDIAVKVYQRGQKIYQNICWSGRVTIMKNCLLPRPPAGHETGTIGVKSSFRSGDLSKQSTYTY